MRNWLEEILQDPSNFTLVLEAAAFYHSEYEKMAKIIHKDSIVGSRLMDLSTSMSGMAEHVHARHSEVQSIVDHLGILETTATQKARKHYIENYNRTLGSHQINDYAKADPAVIKIKEIMLQLTLVMNKWEGVSKGLVLLGYQLHNIVELKKIGLDEIYIN